MRLPYNVPSSPRPRKPLQMIFLAADTFQTRSQNLGTGPRVWTSGRTRPRPRPCPSPPCHPGAVEARSTAKREVEGVARARVRPRRARDRRRSGAAFVPWAEGWPSMSMSAWRTIAPVRPRNARSDGGARPLLAVPRSCPCSAAGRLSARARLCPEKDGSVPCAGRQGVGPRRTTPLLPDCEARDDPGLVARVGCPEVRQLSTQDRTTTQGAGQTEAQGQDGHRERNLGLHKDPGRASHRTEDRNWAEHGGQHLEGGRNRACARAREEADVEAVHQNALGHAVYL